MNTTDNKRSVAADLAKNRLFLECFNYMHSDNLELPTIPEVSSEIRRVINDPYASSYKIARVVQTDPAITARLIQIANSPLYVGQKSIESCPEALTRLGLQATQDIVTAFAIKSVFHAKSPLIRRKMTALWEHSSYIAAICAVFAHKLTGFDPDRAMLAGLIHDIGILPILMYADRDPDIVANPKDLTETVKKLRADIGVQIIRKWGFPEDFEEIVLHAENWHRHNDLDPNYADIVMIAQLHSFIGKVDANKMPQIPKLSAYKKLAVHLKAADSIDILENAKDEIEHIRQLLT